MNHFNKLIALAAVASCTLLSGCADPAAAGAGALTNAMTGAVVGASGGMMNGLQNSLLQNMAGSVINGQIGSQLPAADQSFRLQQLTNVMQSGAITQPQQSVNPQTGSTMQLTPVGQQNYNAQTQQQCQNLQEAVTLPNGQSMTETRTACLNPQTGQWSLVK